MDSVRVVFTHWISDKHRKWHQLPTSKIISPRLLLPIYSLYPSASNAFKTNVRLCDFYTWSPLGVYISLKIKFKVLIMLYKSLQDLAILTYISCDLVTFRFLVCSHISSNPGFSGISWTIQTYPLTVPQHLLFLLLECSLLWPISLV